MKKYIGILLFALPFLVFGTSVQAQSTLADACWVTKQTRSQAENAYAQSCTVRRVDCDPGLDGWVCASLRLRDGFFPTNPPADSTQPPVTDGPCWVTRGTRRQTETAYAQSCTVPRVDCDPGRDGWVCASVRLSDDIFPTNPPADGTQPPEPPQPPNPSGSIGRVGANDLVSLHYDNCPNRDDGHAIPSGKAVVVRTGLSNVLAVNGTCGDDTLDDYRSGSEAVMRAAYGSQWLDYHNNPAASVRAATQRWAQTLSNGGEVWVAEGGPADFTAKVLDSLNSQFPSLNLKNVHVIQHSAGNGSNERKTVRINFVKRLSDYRPIPDGNRGGNGSADLRQESSSFVRIARQSEFASEWNAGFNYFDPDDGLDFSDTVELLYLVDDDSTDSVDDFARNYLR